MQFSKPFIGSGLTYDPSRFIGWFPGKDLTIKWEEKFIQNSSLMTLKASLSNEWSNVFRSYYSDEYIYIGSPEFTAREEAFEQWKTFVIKASSLADAREFLPSFIYKDKELLEEMMALTVQKKVVGSSDKLGKALENWLEVGWEIKLIQLQARTDIKLCDFETTFLYLSLNLPLEETIEMLGVDKYYLYALFNLFKEETTNGL